MNQLPFLSSFQIKWQNLCLAMKHSLTKGKGLIHFTRVRVKAISIPLHESRDWCSVTISLCSWFSLYSFFSLWLIHFSLLWCTSTAPFQFVSHLTLVVHCTLCQRTKQWLSLTGRDIISYINGPHEWKSTAEADLYLPSFDPSIHQLSLLTHTLTLSIWLASPSLVFL